MSVKFTQAGPRLSADDLLPDRNGLGFPVPAAYRDWLLTMNGGTPRPRSFATLDGWPQKRLSVDRFLSLRPPGVALDDSVQSLYHHLVAEVHLPAHFLPIARGVGMDVFFLDVRSTDDGEVWRWDMFGDLYEYEEKEGLFNKVSPGFAALLAGLGRK